MVRYGWAGACNIGPAFGVGPTRAVSQLEPYRGMQRQLVCASALAVVTQLLGGELVGLLTVGGPCRAYRPLPWLRLSEKSNRSPVSP